MSSRGAARMEGPEWAVCMWSVAWALFAEGVLRLRALAEGVVCGPEGPLAVAAAAGDGNEAGPFVDSAAAAREGGNGKCKILGEGLDVLGWVFRCTMVVAPEDQEMRA